MTRKDWIILCLAYIVGLLSTNLITFSTSGFTPQQLSLLIAGLSGLALMTKVAFREQLNTKVGIFAVIVAIIAVLYLQVRIPQPSGNDISYQVTASDSELATVSGTVLTEPRLNNTQRLKFWLQVSAINQAEQVSGKLYATLPILQGTGLYPGQQLQVKGLLYLPQSANNSGGFDFQQYLARQGIFAGIQGTEVIINQQTEPKWGWWKLRRRIVRSQLKGLGSPTGQLVSSMILGRKAVDLPMEIRDRFIEAGLAHVLAASGFHVSLLLGIILKLTESLKAKPRLAIGTGTLVIYLGLTGIQASVLRACLMGFFVLFALAMDTKVKPLGSLLLVATLILLFNPLLISDLGFQLSFLATFGLITTLAGLQAKLDWLPPTVATLFAVPLAASIWTLPLLCYEFNTLATYSILVNILGTPLITMISLGGMISAIAGLMVPALGSAIASVLFYPAQLLVGMTKLFTSLPGSTWAVGQIPLAVLLTIYGLLILVWLSRWWRKRWWLMMLLVLSLIAVTIAYDSNRLQVTILAARQSRIIVIQDRGQTILINSGQNNQAKYTVLPFLAQQGINHLDYGLVFDPSSNSLAAWKEIYQRVKIKQLIDPLLSNYLWDYKVEVGGTSSAVVTKSTRLTINEELAVINLQIADASWLIMGADRQHSKPKIEQYIKQHNLASQHPILVWSGNNLNPAWLELLQPQTAIASTDQISFKIQQQLRQQQIEVYNTAQMGMILWKPKAGFIQGRFD